MANKETLSVVIGEYRARLVQYLHNHCCQSIAMPAPEKTGKLDITGIDDPDDVWSIPNDEDTEDLTWDISSFAGGMPSAEAQEETIPELTFHNQDVAANPEQYALVPVMAAETGEPETTGRLLDAVIEEANKSAEQEQDPVDTEEPADRQTELPDEECPDEPAWGPMIELEKEDDTESYQVAEIPEPKPRRTNLFFQLKKTKPPEKSNIYYMPHQLVAVWSPDGWCKSFTAINLAALAAARGFDTALVNYDLLCPELDIWFGIKQTGLTDRGCDDQSNMGVMTFEGFRPELMLRFLKMRAYGIQYLPAGNKLGNIGTPHDIPLEPLEQTLKVVYNRNTKGKPAITIVDAGRPFEDAPTLAALRQAAIVLIPADGSPASAAIARQQIEELRRLGYNPRFIEVLLATPGRKTVHICQERCSVAFDWNTYLVDRAAMKPQCLRVDGRRAWEAVLNQLATRSGNVFRRL